MKSRLLISLLLMSFAARAFADSANKPNFTDWFPLEELQKMIPGETYVVARGGKQYAGTYVGVRMIDGQKVYVLENAREVDGDSTTDGASEPGRGTPPSRRGDVPSSGALKAGLVAGAGTVLYRLAVFPPKLEREVHQALADLETAESASAAAHDGMVESMERAQDTGQAVALHLARRIPPTPSMLPAVAAPAQSAPEFRAVDPEVRQQLGDAHHRLTTASVSTAVRADARDIGFASLRVAHESFASGQAADGQAALGIATKIADALVGIDPISGFVRDVVECLSGKNIVTGEPLSDWERTFRFVSAGATVATAGAFGAVLRGARILEKSGEVFRKTRLLIGEVPLVESSRRTLEIARTEFRMSSHAVDQAKSRGISPNAIQETVTSGVPYWDRKHLTITYARAMPGSGHTMQVVVSARNLNLVTALERGRFNPATLLDDGGLRWLPIDLY